MLLDDEGPAQRDHHQDSQQPTQHGHQHDARPLELVTQEHQGRHGGADAEGD